MGLRDTRRWLNQYSTLMTIVAIALMLSALGIIFATLQSKPEFRPLPVFYYDVNTGELFAAMSDRIPPITAPSDRLMSDSLSGVRAYVYSCSSCDDASSRFVGYLETYTLDTKYFIQNQQAMRELGDEFQDPEMDDENYQIMMLDEGHLIRGIADEKWVASNSAEGLAIVESLPENCEGELLDACLPDDSMVLVDREYDGF